MVQSIEGNDRTVVLLSVEERSDSVTVINRLWSGVCKLAISFWMDAADMV